MTRPPGDRQCDCVNSLYRSLRYAMVGAAEGARLDAAESLAPLLTAVFAMDA